MSTLKCYNVGTDSSRNYSREGGYAEWISNDAKFRELVVSMVTNGWLAKHPIHAMLIEDDYDFATEAEKRKTFLMNRELKPFRIPTGEYDEDNEGNPVACTTTVEINSSDLVTAYEALVAGGKPKTRQLDGYRRMTACIFANAIRAKVGKEPINEIPVIKIDRVLSIAEQLQICVQENTLTNLGGQTITDIDQLCICRNAVQLGSFTGKSTESQLKKLYGEQGLSRSMQQKLAAIIDLDALFPELDLFRVLRESPRNIKFLDKEVMRPMYKPSTKVDNWEPATPDKVLAYFLAPEEQKKTPPKAVSAKQLSDASTKAKLLPFKELLTGASTGEIDSIVAKYNNHAILINHAIDIIVNNIDNDVLKALHAYNDELFAKQCAAVSE